MDESLTWWSRARHLYERYERRLDLVFFAGGFIFDIFATKGGIDRGVLIAQQAIYLVTIGAILYVDFLREARPETMRFGPRLQRVWAYRGLLLHFCLGTLMNLYSIFFLMSASAFSSIAFVVLLFGAIWANESKWVRTRGVDVKIGLYVLCLFCFFSLMIPLALGHVGRIPFLLALFATVLVLALFHTLLRRRLSAAELRRGLLIPGVSVSACFVAFYFVGLIPPVPLAAKTIGIYHHVERQGDEFVLERERPSWKFWQAGDQDFAAQPGDALYMFVAIVSPARFDDEVFVRWARHDPATGWEQSDRIPVHITGGREGGFRGFTTKQNYSAGEWRVSVETSDAREIRRLYFTVTKVDPNPARVLTSERY